MLATAKIRRGVAVDLEIGDIDAALDKATERHLAPDGNIWEEDPADFKTFVESEEYCGLEPLSDRQLKDILAVIGNDPKKIFSADRNIREGVLLWGKGSGKGYCCSVLQAYAVHVLLCLRNPQSYFYFGFNESLDIINVARTRDQARNIYFEKFTQRVVGNSWFRKHFTIVKDGRPVNDPLAGEDRGRIDILTAMVQFPKNIRAISEHSQNESYEGYNVIYFAMDEASAFKSKLGKENADPVYKTLTTSTRELPYIGFVISYPRHEEDFTVQKYEYSQSPEGSRFMYGSRAATWEVKPSKFYSGVKFKYEFRPGEFVEVPIEYKSQWDKDPEDCRKKYMCVPPKAESPYFEYQEHIDACVVEKENIVLLEDQVVSVGSTVYTVKKILGLNLPTESAKLERFIWVDNGETSCRATLSIGRKATTPSPRLIIEQTLVWYPIPERKIQVSLKNVEEVLVWLANNLNVRVVGWDYWQSSTAKEAIQSMGVQVVRKSLSDNDYSLLKSMIYMHMVEFPNVADGVDELKKLGKREDGGVTKRSGKFKDIADSWVGCCYLVFGKDSMLRGDIGRAFPSPLVGMAVQGSQEAHNLFGTSAQMNVLSQIRDEMSITSAVEKLNLTRKLSQPGKMTTLDSKPPRRSAFPRSIRSRA